MNVPPTLLEPSPILYLLRDVERQCCPIGFHGGGHHCVKQHLPQQLLVTWGKVTGTSPMSLLCPTPLRRAHLLEAGDLDHLSLHQPGIPALARTGSEVGGHLWLHSKFETSLSDNNVSSPYSTTPYPIAVQEKDELCAGALDIKTICVGMKIATLHVLLSNSQLQNRH